MHRTLFPVLIVLGWTVLIGGVRAAMAAPRVEFDIATARGLAPTASHEWLAMMKDLDQDGLRIRAAEAGDEPDVTVVGAGDTAVYRVTGILLAGGVLRLPDASFRLGDKRGLAAWIARLKQGGGKPEAKKGAFGLTDNQLVALHESLAGPVAFATRGQSARTVAGRLVRQLSLEVTSEAGVSRAFDEGGEVADELQGMSVGTALAAVLRPLGLVLAPTPTPAAGVQLRIVDARNADQHWPIGWPTEKKSGEHVPVLLKFLNVEIRDTPLSEAIAAIQQRLEIPVLWDHNAMARQRIVPERTVASVPGGKTFYAKVLDRLLWPAKLSWEVRVDEAEKPFLWIFTKLK